MASGYAMECSRMPRCVRQHSISVCRRAGSGATLTRRDWLPGLTPAQRSYLGFPSADSSFWTAETIARTAARYPALDIRPMQAQIRSGDGTRNQREGVSPTETVLSDEQCEQWRRGRDCNLALAQPRGRRGHALGCTAHVRAPVCSAAQRGVPVRVFVLGEFGSNPKAANTGDCVVG